MEIRDFSMNETQNLYCGRGWRHFWRSYDTVHDYGALIITFLGCATNLCSMWVFTRRNMRNPLNTVLTVLAIADFLLMLNGFLKQVYIIHSHLTNEPDRHSYLSFVSYRHALLDLLYAICYYLFVTWGIYLTVLVAVWRLIGVLRPFKSRRWLTERVAKWSIFSTTLLSIILVALMFFEERIEGSNLYVKRNSSEENGSLHHHSELFEQDEDEEMSSTVKYNSTEYHLMRSNKGWQVMSWTYGLLVKMVPCVILSVSCIGMIVSIVKANKRRKDMEAKNNSGRGQGQVNGGSSSNGNHNNSSAVYTLDKTTRMLFVILLIFIVTELPDGIVGMTYIISNSKEFRRECFSPIANFLIILEYISGLSSFLVYITMSSAYRQTLTCTFRKKKLPQKSIRF